jgi:putative acetyltransferase
VGEIVIEPELRTDVDAIHQVVARAFAHHPQVADMVAAIRRSPRYRPGLALVARDGKRVVGFVMLSGTDLVDDGGVRRDVLTLSPLAVDPDYERRGIGTALVRAALDAADRRDEPLVLLEGSPQYYSRMGFVFAGRHGITIDLPDWAPAEAAQVFLLRAYEPAVRGHVHYPPAIAAVSG